MATLGAACADDNAANSQTSGTTSAAETSTLEGGSNTTGTPPDGWPDAWYGDFYQTVGFELGQPFPGEVIGYFRNFRIESGRLTVDYFVCTGEGGQRIYAASIEGDTIGVDAPGAEILDWPGEAELSGVSIHPGATCGDAMLERRFTSGPDTMPLQLTRGRLCLVESCC